MAGQGVTEVGRATRSVPRHRLASKAEMQCEHEAALAAAERKLHSGERASAVLSDLRGAAGERRGIVRLVHVVLADHNREVVDLIQYEEVAARK